jgi:hypothetical protein
VIPQSVRNQVSVNVGDLFDATVVKGKITLTPKSLVDRAIAEGLDDVKHGRVYGPFDTVDEMLSSLKNKRRKNIKPTSRR